MSDTAIEWTDRVWNPTTGCDRVSPGCDHCYAMTMAKRLKGMGSAKYQKDGDPRTSGPGFGVSVHLDTLDQPIRWRKPQRIFVNSMSDLFHDSVPDEYIARAWATMALTPRHTYQLLTKRHGRMRSLIGSERFAGHVYRAVNDILAQGDPPRIADDVIVAALDGFCRGNFAVLPNVWGMVSAEDQRRAELRIPALLATPFAVRGVSAEPLLGPIELGDWAWGGDRCPDRQCNDSTWDHNCTIGARRLDWVIVGGESGRGARPMHPDWARSLRDQCQAAGVAFLFKQWGEYRPAQPGVDTWDQLNTFPVHQNVPMVDGAEGEWTHMRRVGKKAAGRELDGRTWDQYPGEVTA
jgi:protein gp37